MPIKTKRVYEQPSKDDGIRILVDRLWPRGLIKQDAKIDRWVRDIAPSNDLRKWFDHDPAKWAEFKRRYSAELIPHRAAIRELKKLASENTVTLLYSAKNTVHNNAVALLAKLQ